MSSGSIVEGCIKWGCDGVDHLCGLKGDANLCHTHRGWGNKFFSFIYHLDMGDVHVVFPSPPSFLLFIRFDYHCLSAFVCRCNSWGRYGNAPPKPCLCMAPRSPCDVTADGPYLQLSTGHWRLLRRARSAREYTLALLPLPPGARNAPVMA